MNKGLKIRNNKLRKNTAKRNTVKPDQIHICRFVEIRYQIIQKINGTFKRIGAENVRGLQIRNRVYLNSGKYKLINNKGTKIIKIYDDVPEWANDDLKTRYKDFCNNENKERKE